MSTTVQRMWQEAEADFAPDNKIQVHSYALEIWMDLIRNAGRVCVQLSPDEARQLAAALINAADRVDKEQA